jgi:hypothetical protein
VRPLIAIVAVLLSCVETNVFADDPKTSQTTATSAGLSIPASLLGKVEGRGISLNAKWSLSDLKWSADGTIRGKVTYPGIVCSAEEADFAGRFDGTTLTIPMPFGSAYRCQGFVFVLSRKAGTSTFTGEYSGTSFNGYPYSLILTLNPE